LVAVDGERLFVSSANLTEFALNLNIEVGVLLQNKSVARQATENLYTLIRIGVLELATS